MANEIQTAVNIDANAILKFQASMVSQASFEEAATTFATELCQQQGFERVSVGMLEDGQCNIYAVSHSAETHTKLELNQQLSLAMEEAMTQAAIIVVPETAPSQPRIIQANQALHKFTNHQIFTIPLVNRGEIFGAVCIEQVQNKSISTNSIADLTSLISLMAPILYLLHTSETSWFKRLKQSIATTTSEHLLGKHGLVQPILWLSTLAIFALLFLPVAYHVSAPARLEGAIQRALVAPENGYLEQSFVRPGDIVKANQVLATLADQELLLEKRRWETELAQYENAYSTSLAQSNRVDLVINQNKAEEARVQLALIEQKLQHTQVIAPFDGVIIKGDLKDAVGAPLQRGDTLLTIAPIEAFRLIIEVDERDIAEVKQGQTGQLALVSIPNQRNVFEVARLMPVAIVKDGRNLFEVEGTIQAKQLKMLKPGLEGVAKIAVGKRSVIWILSHRVTDWFRLNLWSWGL